MSEPMIPSSRDLKCLEAVSDWVESIGRRLGWFEKLQLEKKQRGDARRGEGGREGGDGFKASCTLGTSLVLKIRRHLSILVGPFAPRPSCLLPFPSLSALHHFDVFLAPTNSLLLIRILLQIACIPPACNAPFRPRLAQRSRLKQHLTLDRQRLVSQKQ